MDSAQSAPQKADKGSDSGSTRAEKALKKANTEIGRTKSGLAEHKKSTVKIKGELNTMKNKNTALMREIEKLKKTSKKKAA